MQQRCAVEDGRDACTQLLIHERPTALSSADYSHQPINLHTKCRSPLLDTWLLIAGLSDRVTEKEKVTKQHAKPPSSWHTSVPHRRSYTSSAKFSFRVPNCVLMS
ncbi:unnamed protein product, partial [Ectocarpus sp. 13 AM-2016]